MTSMKGVQDGGDSIRFDQIKANDGVKSKEIGKKELVSKGLSDVSRTGKNSKTKEALNTVMSVLRGVWSKKSTSPTIVNTKIAGTTSNAVASRPSARAENTESNTRTPEVGKRPGPGLGQKIVERKNYNAMTPEVGKRPLPSPGQKIGDQKNYNAMRPETGKRPLPEAGKRPLPVPGQANRKSYNAMTPEAFKKALEAEEENALVEEDINSLPPSDLPPAWSDDLLPTEGEKLLPAEPESHAVEPSLTELLSAGKQTIIEKQKAEGTEKLVEEGFENDWDEETVKESNLTPPNISEESKPNLIKQPVVDAKKETTSSFLDEIKGGKNLKKADERKIEEKVDNKTGSLEQTLKDALDKNRGALGGDVDNADKDEPDEW